MQRDLLILGGTGDTVFDAVAALRLHVEQAVTIGRAVGHGGIGNTLGILHARPERATGRAHVVLVQRPCALPALFRRPEHLALVVGVTTEDQRVLHLLQQREQPRAVFSAIGFIEQRNVEAQHHQLVLGDGGEITLKEGELVFAQATDIRRLPARLGDDVVHADEHHRRLFPGVGVRPEIAVVTGQRCGIALRAEVHVMIAGYMQPRHAE
ncbi:hypothetical protein D3C71_1579650 [compost metagenome]